MLSHTVSIFMSAPPLCLIHCNQLCEGYGAIKICFIGVLVNHNLITKILLQQILILYNVTLTCRGLISGGWLCDDGKCKGGQTLDLNRPNIGIGSMFGLVVYFLFRKYGGGTMRPYRNKTTPVYGIFFW